MSATGPRRVEVPAGREDVEQARPWNVVMWNDPVNLMEYVVWVLRRLFGYPEGEATRLMLTAHREGRAVVAACPREQAELAVHRLHHHGLQATLERT